VRAAVAEGDARRDHGRRLLAGIDADPLELFLRWLGEAIDAGEPEPTAMTLATAGSDASPSARMVLMKGADERGLRFFTNYESPKARELEENPRAALVAWWAETRRQVRVRGPVERLPPEESDEYFASRPHGSRLAAWASDQSRPLGDRAELEERFTALEREYEGREIPRPPHWGGFRLVPEEWEFWSGRPNRLHDRLLYRRAGTGAWAVERLAP
jgi:pyridoxamine 5'-phosphate oxidase